MKKILYILFCIFFITINIKAEPINYKNFSPDKENEFSQLYKRFYVREEDNLEKISYYKITNDLSTKGTELKYLLFNINVIETKEKKEIYIIIASMGNKEPEIYDCVFYIDGKKYPLSFEYLGNEEKKSKTGIAEISECLLCKNTDNVIPNMINAQNVILRIKSHCKKMTDFTRDTNIDIPLSEQHFYNIQKFYKEVIAKK